MTIVADTTVIIAVITDEPVKPRLLDLTRSTDIIAPLSLHWELGNAFSAMFKRGRLTEPQAIEAIELYRLMPVRLVQVDLRDAVKLAAQLQIYAYDAYMVSCALSQGAPLLSLDRGLCEAARRAGVNIVEVPE